MDAATLYQDRILQRARSPLHAGRLQGVEGRAENRSCGDSVGFSLDVLDGRIAEARHETQGCAICQASADLIAGLVAGEAASVEGLKRGPFATLWEEALQALAGTLPASAPSESDAQALLGIFDGVSAYRSRHRCAILPRQALDAALRGAEALETDRDK